MPEISDAVISAAIAALVSFLVSLASYWIARQRLSSEERRFERGVARDLVLKLYDLRLTHYGQAFDITSRLALKTGNVYLGTPADVQRAAHDLTSWKQGKVNLIISTPALQAYQDLQDALAKPPTGVAGDETLYSKEQAEKIISLRNTFRRTLRNDIQTLSLDDLLNRDFGRDA